MFLFLQAIFDAIMVHMMNQVTSDTWQVQVGHRHRYQTAAARPRPLPTHTPCFALVRCAATHSTHPPAPLRSRAATACVVCHPAGTPLQRSQQRQGTANAQCTGQVRSDGCGDLPVRERIVPGHGRRARVEGAAPNAGTQQDRVPSSGEDGYAAGPGESTTSVKPLWLRHSHICWR